MKVVLIGLALLLLLISADADADRKRELSIKSITQSLDLNQTRSVESKLNKHLQLYPDDADAYGQLSRLIMKQGNTNSEGLLGYKFTPEADQKALAALQKALELDPQNATEQSRLGYLHAVQGRYKKAEAVFATISADQQPLWLGYNKAIAAIGVGENEKAAALLDPITSTRPADQNNRPAWSVYRAAWTLRKGLALQDSATDPIAPIREGRMRRVAIDDFYDEALASGKSDKPILAFISSSDSGCQPCVGEIANLSNVAEALGEQYELIYTSVEPWSDIKKKTVLLRAFNIRGVPMHAIMYGDRRIADQGGLFPVARFADYRNAVPKILNGEYKGNKVDSYDSLLTQDIHHQVIAKLNEKTNFRASAVARDGRAWTSGIVGGRSSQKEADRDAIQRCQRNVENWGLNTTCQLYNKR